ncbi:hypothetical protein VP01_450g1, partial [Puccinia sorghi]
VKPLTSGEYIGHVKSLWRVQSSFILFVVRMKASTIISYYRMREFVTTNKACLAISTDIVCTDTKVQHNKVCHTDCVKYILNSASFHASEENWRMACLPISRVKPLQCLHRI